MASNPRIDERAVVHPDAEIGEGTFIGPFCVIGADVKFDLPKTRVVIDARWTRGLSSIDNSDENLDIKNSAITVAALLLVGALITALAADLLVPHCSWAVTVPTINIGVEDTENPEKVATFLEIILLLTIVIAIAKYDVYDVKKRQLMNNE